MSATNCETCRYLRRVVEIRTPGELARAIRIIRSSLEDQSITDITQAAHSPSGDFGDLPDSGPWPDYVEHYFKCTACGHRFRLAVDTYHGAGGTLDGELECY
jgi:hypothetical protein